MSAGTKFTQDIQSSAVGGFEWSCIWLSCIIIRDDSLCLFVCVWEVVLLEEGLVGGQGEKVTMMMNADWSTPMLHLFFFFPSVTSSHPRWLRYTWLFTVSPMTHCFCRLLFSLVLNAAIWQEFCIYHLNDTLHHQEPFIGTGSSFQQLAHSRLSAPPWEGTEVSVKIESH